jgi:hypothetical protein
VISGVAVISFFIAGFLIGFFPAHSRVDRLQTENAELRRQNANLQQSLRIAELRGVAGLMNHRVGQNNYGAAAKLSTGFFNGLRQAIATSSDEALRDNLRAMLQQRDEITVSLAQADPAVKQKLEQIYADFFQMRHG